MNKVNVGTLAWSLVDAANSFIDTTGRAAVCAKIGAGEQDSAIRDLLVIYARNGARLPAQSAAGVRQWMAGYADTDSAALLQYVYDRVKVSVARTSDDPPAQPELDRPPALLVARRSEYVERIEATQRPNVPTAVDELGGTDLLDGLNDGITTERTELIAWLRGQGFSVEQIRNEPAPMLLPARRALGDDGNYVSAREVSEVHGIDLELLQNLIQALGLPKVGDPDAPCYLRADAETAARQQQLIDMGLDADRVVLVVRRLAEGLSVRSGREEVRTEFDE